MANLITLDTTDLDAAELALCKATEERDGAVQRMTSQIAIMMSTIYANLTAKTEDGDWMVPDETIMTIKLNAGLDPKYRLRKPTSEHTSVLQKRAGQTPSRMILPPHPLTVIDPTNENEIVTIISMMDGEWVRVYGAVPVVIDGSYHFKHIQDQILTGELSGFDFVSEELECRCGGTLYTLRKYMSNGHYLHLDAKIRYGNKPQQFQYLIQVKQGGDPRLSQQQDGR
jgi:hypothetical protein